MKAAGNNLRNMLELRIDYNISKRLFFNDKLKEPEEEPE